MSSEPRWRPRKLNECIAAAKRIKPAESHLFDDFWRTGDLAILFGAAGTAKSILAMQIADSIARGRPINGFRMSSRRRKVLHVDLKGTERQLAQRYSRPLKAGSRMQNYKFSENLYRDSPPAGISLAKWLRKTVEDGNFQAVIIDDIFAIRRSFDGTRETLTEIRELKRICSDLDTSLLVLASSRSPVRGQLVSEVDLMRSRVLCEAADSVFAIGENPQRPNSFYLIQTRCQASAIFWTSKNAPLCDITRTEDGFLSLKFDKRFDVKIPEETRQLICNIKWRRDAKVPFREIANELGISRTHAARLAKRWTPAMDPAEFVDDDPELTERYFRHLAERAAKTISNDIADSPSSITPTEAKPLDSPPGSDDVGHEASNGNTQNSTTMLDEPPPETSLPPLDTPRDILMALGYRRDFDKNEREIFIEKEEDTGFRRVWYRFDLKSKRSGEEFLKRVEHKVFGTSDMRVDGPISLFYTC